MLIINQFDPPWQTANIFVLTNAFEMFCFPLCITGIVFFLYNASNRIVLNQIKSHCIVRSHRIGSCFICIFNVSYRWRCIEMRIASASVMEMHIPTKWINKLIMMIFKNLKRNLLKNNSLIWEESKRDPEKENQTTQIKCKHGDTSRQKPHYMTDPGSSFSLHLFTFSSKLYS